LLVNKSVHPKTNTVELRSAKQKKTYEQAD